MPGHYRSPYGYSYFNPTGKEQAALTIGSLLAGALAASSGQSKGDAIRKGIAGTMAGYGSGYQNYQNLMGDAFGRDLQTKSYGQRVKEYEETEKPYRQSIIDMRNQRGAVLPQEKIPTSRQEYEYYKGLSEEEKPLFEKFSTNKREAKNKTADDYMNEIAKIDTQIAKLQSSPSVDRDSINTAIDSQNRRRAMLQRKLDTIEGRPLYTDPIIKEGIKNMFMPPQTQPQPSNQGVTPITLDQFLNEARKVNPGVSDDELTQFWINKYKK